ncbi:major facilitator superfamily domain-containing protein [Zychaea mexicana]|uniref:major facilitator superfamily domain-containing protein n=1 Tax=Zychaea mexicana TaxID=64656 RepID=UPI0022FED352|nr:major facilitator superfamily domain-containing protein [Zychaea mexicana]KAI9499294.1 major facilitator superfamily domain-containing protein [Zychaea mexicana]
MEKRASQSLYAATDEQYEAYDTSYGYSVEDEPEKSSEERALVRKLDLYIMPIVCVLDFIQFLDKSTINYAALFNFKEELNLQGSEYSLLGSIFYLGYLLYQFPNNFFLQRFAVARYIGVIVVLWGIVLACTALGKNFAQVAAMRFLLGLFEAGIYPAMTLLISTCYRRSEQAARLGAFWIWNGVALIIGGLITYGIGSMENDLGISRWKWIMIILGACTVFMGIFSFFFLIDNPKSKALKLNAEQEILVEERTRDNSVVRTTTIKIHQIKEALGEIRFWAFGLACMLINLQNGAMTIYNAQIVQDFGFTQLESVLLTIGSGGADIVFIIGAVICARKSGNLLYTACGLMCIDILGLILLLVIPVTRVKLVGFYMAWAYCAAYVLMIASISNNVSGYTKKIFYNGSLMVFYTIGNFVGPLLMITPPYIPGMLTYIGANVLVVILLLIARWKMATVNRYRLARSSGVVTNVEDDLSDVADPNYIYTM